MLFRVPTWTAKLLFIGWRETENRNAVSLVCSLFMFSEYVLGRIRPINCSRHKASVQLGCDSLFVSSQSNWLTNLNK